MSMMEVRHFLVFWEILMSVFDGFRFRRVSSPVHRLDPRVKFIYVFVVFIVAIMFNEMVPILLLFLS